MILRALKRFGLIFADQGTTLYVQGTTDPAFARLLDELNQTPERRIPLSEFEVLDTDVGTVCGWVPADGDCF